MSNLEKGSKGQIGQIGDPGDRGDDGDDSKLVIPFVLIPGFPTFSPPLPKGKHKLTIYYCSKPDKLNDISFFEIDAHAGKRTKLDPNETWIFEGYNVLRAENNNPSTPINIVITVDAL